MGHYPVLGSSLRQASRRGRGRKYARESFNELLIRIQQRVVDTFDHSLHCQQTDCGDVGHECHKAGLDLGAAGTLLSFLAEFPRCARVQKIVQRADARELLRVEMHSAFASDLTM